MRISFVTVVDQVYTLKHDITDVQCLMPGLILAIRKVVRLKVPSINHFLTYFSIDFTDYTTLFVFPGQNLVYGLEKFL